LIQELNILEKDLESTLSNLMKDFGNRLNNLQATLENDSIESQNRTFKMQKDITLLDRECIKMSNQVDNIVVTADYVEDRMFGKNLFDLEAAHDELDHIQESNLRLSHSNFMKKSQVIH